MKVAAAIPGLTRALNDREPELALISPSPLSVIPALAPGVSGTGLMPLAFS